MAAALKLGVLGAVLALIGSAALAGEAPAVYYPSLGYGQTPPAYDGPPEAYVDEPAYAGEPAYGPRMVRPVPGPMGPPPPCGCVPPPPPPPCCRRGPPPAVYRGEAGRGDFDRGYAERGYGYGGYAERGFGERRYGEHAYGEVRRDEYDYDSGWRIRRIPLPPECPYARMAPPHPVCGVERERYVESEQLPDIFFADAGGVGPDEFEWGGGGGGMIVGGGASAGSFAFASASARASAGIRIRVGRHGGGFHHGGHGPHGCGCRR